MPVIPRLPRLILLLAAFVAAPLRASVDRGVFDPIVARIVKIEAITDQGGYSLGSGLPVAPGVFLTNCHVTARARAVHVLHQGLRWPAEAQRSNLERDICLLRVPKLDDMTPIPRAGSQRLRVGQGVVAAGYTFGAGLSIQSGTVRALHPTEHGTVIQSATYFNSGASGGGLFTERGELVAVLTFRLRDAEAFYFSIPSEWIDDELARDAPFTPIAPLPPAPPFWARPVEQLPYFMQAATLQARRQWDAVVTLTERWTLAEPGNGESWFVRGEALAQLDRHAEAAEAFRQATTAAPLLADAWYQLGRALQRTGDTEALAATLIRLAALDPALAEALKAPAAD